LVSGAVVVDATVVVVDATVVVVDATVVVVEAVVVVVEAPVVVVEAVVVVVVLSAPVVVAPSFEEQPATVNVKTPKATAREATRIAGFGRVNERTNSVERFLAITDGLRA
jgi:hypothetical protein